MTTRPQSDRKARAIDLSIGTYLNNGFGTDEEMAKAFEPASPWQRRRAAKRETDEKEEIAVTESGEEGGYREMNETRNQGRDRVHRDRHYRIVGLHRMYMMSTGREGAGVEAEIDGRILFPRLWK